MKLKKILALVLAAVLTLSLAACGGSGNNPGTNTPSDAPSSSGNSDAQAPGTSGGATGDTISLRLWGGEEDQALLKELVENFKAAYPDQTFDIQIGVESESTAKDTVLTDIEAAADVFAFADDQLDTLLAAGALMNITAMDEMLKAYANKSVADITAANGAGAVAAATRDGNLYAFPMSGGNTYFLFYDSRVISAEQAKSWDTLMEAAAAAGSKVGMPFASGWYNASFFLGAGFTTARNADNSTYIDWNGTSPTGITGVQVVQAMQAIAANPGFVSSSDIANQMAAGNLCAAVDGNWDAEIAEKAYEDGYCVTKLPTFTCAGKQVQQGSFTGFKLIGVNAYAKNAGWAVLLAEFLTNEESQVTRFAERQLPPTNNVAGADESVTSNPAVAAAIAQDEFGVVQSVSDSIWDPLASFGEQIAQGVMTTDEAGIQAALDELVAGVGTPMT